MIYFSFEKKQKLKSFINNINKMHPTIKFMADWSKTPIKFTEVTVSITEGMIKSDLYIHQYLSAIRFIAKMIFHISRH